MTTRIFIVAQHAEFQRFLAQFVRYLGQGYEVVGATSQLEAGLAAIDTLEPDLALVDAELEEGRGLAIAATVRRRRSSTAVIVLGRTGDTEYRRAAFAAGAVGYISKFDLVATLPAALRAALPLST